MSINPFRTLDNTRHAIPYGISPDGQSATGWVQQYNRTACYWDAEGNTNILSDYQSPWSSGRSFSPDGTFHPQALGFSFPGKCKEDAKTHVAELKTERS